MYHVTLLLTHFLSKWVFDSKILFPFGFLLILCLILLYSLLFLCPPILVLLIISYFASSHAIHSFQFISSIILHSHLLSYNSKTVILAQTFIPFLRSRPLYPTDYWTSQQLFNCLLCFQSFQFSIHSSHLRQWFAHHCQI